MRALKFPLFALIITTLAACSWLTPEQQRAHEARVDAEIAQANKAYAQCMATLGRAAVQSHPSARSNAEAVNALSRQAGGTCQPSVDQVEAALSRSREKDVFYREAYVAAVKRSGRDAFVAAMYAR